MSNFLSDFILRVISSTFQFSLSGMEEMLPPLSTAGMAIDCRSSVLYCVVEKWGYVGILIKLMRLGGLIWAFFNVRCFLEDGTQAVSFKPLKTYARETHSWTSKTWILSFCCIMKWNKQGRIWTKWSQFLFTAHRKLTRTLTNSQHTTLASHTNIYASWSSSILQN